MGKNEFEDGGGVMVMVREMKSKSVWIEVRMLHGVVAVVCLLVVVGVGLVFSHTRSGGRSATRRRGREGNVNG